MGAERIQRDTCRYRGWVISGISRANPLMLPDSTPPVAQALYLACYAVMWGILVIAAQRSNKRDGI